MNFNMPQLIITRKVENGDEEKKELYVDLRNILFSPVLVVIIINPSIFQMSNVKSLYFRVESHRVAPLVIIHFLLLSPSSSCPVHLFNSIVHHIHIHSIHIRRTHHREGWSRYPWQELASIEMRLVCGWV